MLRQLNMPCPYANALGEPGKGVHAARIFGLARNDLIMTIIAAFITAYIFNITFFQSFAAWFILGEVLHYREVPKLRTPPLGGVNLTFGTERHFRKNII